jgi:N-acylneuraminate cytidylyltransferase
MRLAIIPARGGSKRIPRKNIRLFGGRPMIAWSIQAAIASRCFDEVMVSTDDGEIAEVARSHGADVPFVRPAALADDHVGTIPVIRHALEWSRDHRRPVDEACCIYATAPFIRGDDLRHGLETLIRHDCDYVFSVTSYPFPIQRAIRISADGTVEMFHPEHFNTRSQDLEEAFHDAGQFYWGRAEAWLAGRIIFGSRSRPVILPRHRVQDIDTAEDWVRAEWLFKALEAHGEVGAAE